MLDTEEQPISLNRNEEDNEPGQFGSKPIADGFFSDFSSNDACSVAVAVRVRPLVGRELAEGNKKLCITKNEEADTPNKIMIGTRSFNFDRVFWPDVSQEFIFE